MNDGDARSPMNLSLGRLSKDPLARILLENSHLSKVQFQTFLIDVLWSAGREASRETRVRVKSDRRRVSKGAFNRTLSQARGNVVKSIYTLFLLSYFGLFDSPKLEPFIRLGNEMQTVLEARLETSEIPDSDAHMAAKVLEDALEAAVRELATMTAFKRQRNIT